MKEIEKRCKKEVTWVLRYNEKIYKGLLLNTKINAAIAYLLATDETEKHTALVRKLNEKLRLEGQYLQQIQICYQIYWQAIFQQLCSHPDAKISEVEWQSRQRLEQNLNQLHGKRNKKMEELEEDIQTRLAAEELFFLGGKTGLFFGPYIWKEEEETSFSVILPEGKQQVQVKRLRGFLLRSWLAWLSDNEFGTAGWASEKQLFCVEEAYPEGISSAKFQISFLKHEAQHLRDYRFEKIKNDELEYRAKLVELINYEEVDFFSELLAMADTREIQNGHAFAAARIKQQLIQTLAVSSEFLEELTTSNSLWQENKDHLKRSAKKLLFEDTKRLEERQLKE